MKKEHICGGLFLVWFFASLGLAWYFSETDRALLCIPIVGQVFLVIGIAAVCAARDQIKSQLVILMFPIIGAGMIVGGILSYFDISLFHQTAETICSLMMINVFTVAGVLFLLQRRFREKKCTYPIQGKCVDVRTDRMRSNHNGRTRYKTVYCPVYEIYYKDELHTICNNEYTNYGKPVVGNSYALKINPDKPSEFTDYRSVISKMITSAIGFVFIITGLGITALVLLQGEM
jgi:hypothetical protein